MLDDFAFINLGVPELLVVLLIALLLFGGAKLPELARSIGSSLSELRKGLGNESDQDQDPHPSRHRPA